MKAKLGSLFFVPWINLVERHSRLKVGDVPIAGWFVFGDAKVVREV
jgi:hypothetical protein